MLKPSLSLLDVFSAATSPVLLVVVRSSGIAGSSTTTGNTPCLPLRSGLEDRTFEEKDEEDEEEILLSAKFSNFIACSGAAPDGSANMEDKSDSEALEERLLDEEILPPASDSGVANDDRSCA